MRQPGSLPVVAAVLVACGGTEAVPPGSMVGPWRASIDTIGDTLVVNTISGSEWREAHLVEELRIGVVAGAEHETFGSVDALAAVPSGGVLVYDAQATSIRRYDETGGYAGTIGGAGEGPGEYRNVAGLTVLQDGRIVVNDFGNGRFNLYTPEGLLLQTWLLRPTMAEMRPLYSTPDGGVFLHDNRFVSGRPTQEEILVRISSDGSPRDTLVIPAADYRPAALEVRTANRSIGMPLPFSPTSEWSVTSRGDVVSMIGDRYAVHVVRPDGSLLQIKRSVEPVPVSAEERSAEMERVTTQFQRFVDGWRWNGPSIPDVKPPISWLHTGQDGTIWVRIARAGEAVPAPERDRRARTWVSEPVVFDVFDSSGRFLGQVHAPPSLRLQPHPVLGLDRVWAVVQDENDISYVARFRVDQTEVRDGS